jgi:predicted adenylyl cyclase CyaB
MSEPAEVKRVEPEEWELKFQCPSLEDLREKLRDLEAERLSAASAEDNRVYDRDGRLRKENKLLRLRIEPRGSRLTFKGPPRYEGQVKIRVEHETEVEDADQIDAILANLGFEVVRRYQKKREEWHVGGVTVSLDHTPIGDFVEFEGTGADAVAKRCGFELDNAESRTYVELYEDYRRDNPDAPPDMVFS